MPRELPLPSRRIHRDARTVEGDDDAHDRVLEWLTSIVTGHEKEDELKVELIQKSKTTPLAIKGWEFGLDEEVEDLVEEIIDAAVKDAMSPGYSGRVRYAVTVKGVAKHQAFTLFVPKIDEDEELDEEDLASFDETPSRKGLIHQQMRHTEAIMRLALSQSRQGREDLIQENRELRATNQALLKERFDLIGKVEEINSMEFMRERELRKLEKAEQRADQVVGVLTRAVPMIASKYLGPANAEVLMAAPASPIENMIEGWVSSLETNPEKLQKIMSVLDPIDMQMFAEIQRQMAAKKQAQAQQGPQNGQNGQQNGTPPWASSVGSPPASQSG